MSIGKSFDRDRAEGVEIATIIWFTSILLWWRVAASTDGDRPICVFLHLGLYFFHRAKINQD